MSRIPKNDVLYLGMNKTAREEAKALRGAHVDVIADSKAGDDKIKVGKKTYDLTTDQGRKDFVATLGLPQAQSDTIADVLKNAQPDARDELAQLAQAWAKGETGGDVPGRLVLSGHSSGGKLWGSEHDSRGNSTWENGYLMRDDFLALANAMPKAAAQVQDIGISACFCGGESDLLKWKSAFPNVKTVTAYDGFSPSVATGSKGFLKKWEKATRGDVDTLKPEAFNGTNKAENIATWTLKNGYVVAGGKEKPEIVKGRIDTFQNDERAKYMSGEKTSATSLQAYYTDLQDLANRPTTSAADKTALQAEIEVMVRLRHYKSIAPKFDAANKAALKDGFEAVGMKTPNFGKLTRAEAMKKIGELETKVNATSPAPAAATEALRLLKGLASLDDKSIIPWAD